MTEQESNTLNDLTYIIAHLPTHSEDCSMLSEVYDMALATLKERDDLQKTSTTSLARHDKAVADGTTIESPWSVEDVYGLAEDSGYPITEDDAKSVLSSVKKNFDANIGVNWEVLQYYLDDLDLTPVSKLKAKTFHTN